MTWLVLALAAAVAGGLALAWAAEAPGGTVLGAADALVLRFQSADGKLAKTLRVQGNGGIAWYEKDKDAKIVGMTVSLEHNGVVAPFAAGGVNSGLVDPDEFLIGPGDVLDINAWKKPEISRQVPVRPDGRITMPLLGDVYAAGRTTNQFRDELNAAFGRFYPDPEVTVTVAQVHSYQCFVQGQVTHPGAYLMNGRTTVVQAIGLAGGFTQFAATGRIAVLRQTSGGSQRFEVNYDRIVAGKIADVPVRSGDTIVVP